MSVTLATRYHDQLQALSTSSSRRMLGLWRRMEPWDVAASLRWAEMARPIIEATAQAAIDLTGAYGEASGAPVQPTPSLFVADAGAHLWEPWDRLGARLSATGQMADALTSAAGVAEEVGIDAVHGSSRAATSYTFPGQPVVRRLHAGACDWCMSMSKIEFSSAAEADFGHTHCKCAPTLVDDIGNVNDRIRSDAGWDEAAEVRFRKRHQIRRLEDQIANAQKRSRKAAAEQLTETDPARLERLSIREQDWETRAEAAAERLRILVTGSHRLAA